PSPRQRASVVLLSFLTSLSTHAATTEIYSLSLHDALPICAVFGMDHPAADEIADAVGLQLRARQHGDDAWHGPRLIGPYARDLRDRKSTRLNSSHVKISYAVFCLKKKKKQTYVRRADNNTA